MGACSEESTQCRRHCQIWGTHCRSTAPDQSTVRGAQEAHQEGQDPPCKTAALLAKSSPSRRPADAAPGVVSTSSTHGSQWLALEDELLLVWQDVPEN